MGAVIPTVQYRTEMGGSVLRGRMYALGAHTRRTYERLEEWPGQTRTRMEFDLGTGAARDAVDKSTSHACNREAQSPMRVNTGEGRWDDTSARDAGLRGVVVVSFARSTSCSI